MTEIQDEELRWVRAGDKRVNLAYVSNIRVREIGSPAYAGIDPRHYVRETSSEEAVLKVPALELYHSKDVDYRRDVVRAYADDAAAILRKLGAMQLD